MHNGAIRADQKIAVGEHGGGVPEVHGLAYDLLSRNEFQIIFALQLFVALPFLNGDELHIVELAKRQVLFEGK